MGQSAQEQHHSTVDADVGVPDAVLAYARRQRRGEAVIQAWQLHATGGLSAPECSRRLNVHPDTVRRWFHAIRNLLGIGKDSAQTGPDVTATGRIPVNNAVLKASDVAEKRANLLRTAEQHDKWDL